MKRQFLMFLLFSRLACVGRLDEMTPLMQFYSGCTSKPVQFRGQVETMVSKSMAIGTKGIILDPDGEFRERANAARGLKNTAEELFRPACLTIGSTTIGLVLGWRNYSANQPREADYGRIMLFWKTRTSLMAQSGGGPMCIWMNCESAKTTDRMLCALSTFFMWGVNYYNIRYSPNVQRADTGNGALDFM